MILSKVFESDTLNQGFVITGLANPFFPSLDLSVVLNPTCLFENNKVDSIIVAYLIPAEFVLSKNRQWISFKNELSEPAKKGDETISKLKAKSLENILGVLIDNDEPRRHFFIGSLPEIGLVHSFVDFQQVASFALNTVQERIKLVAKIKSPYREQMATNYAGYMMRIGVERYGGTDRTRILSTLASPLLFPKD
jgi:hypothetical protein